MIYSRIVQQSPGAGKSTMLAAAREAWEAQGYRVHGAALAGKAAEGLEESAGIASRTLASWERGWERGFDKLGPKDVFVIDEAGMVGSKQLSRFIQEADLAGAKIVLVGDPEQLQPIGPGAAFRAVAERVGFVELEEIRRQRAGWQREASVDFGRHRTSEGLAAYAAHGAVSFAETGKQAREAIVRDVAADMQERPDGSRLVLAHRNVDVQALNEAIRSVRKECGELVGEQVYQTSEGERAFAAGDRVLFRENNRDLGVKNGMLGTVVGVTGLSGAEGVDGLEGDGEQRLVVRLDSSEGPGRGRVVSVSMADYAAVDHGYATTIHKSQGATVDRAYVLASGTMDRHLTYVAMTRHRDGVQLYADNSEFSDVGALAERLSRSQAKETTLDYERRSGPVQAAQKFAERRGLDVRSEIIVPQTMREHVAQGYSASSAAVSGTLSGAALTVEVQKLVDGATLASDIATGRAGFRARYEAHKQKKELEAARDEGARKMVDLWKQVAMKYKEALPSLLKDPELGGARDRFLMLAEMFEKNAGARRFLRDHAEAYGIKDGSVLSKVLASSQPRQELVGLLQGIEAKTRNNLQQEAELKASLARQRWIERDHGIER